MCPLRHIETHLRVHGRRRLRGCNNNKQYITTYNTDRSSIFVTQHISKLALAFHLTVQDCPRCVGTILGPINLFNKANTKAGLPKFSTAFAHNLQDVITIFSLQDGKSIFHRVLPLVSSYTRCPHLKVKKFTYIDTNRGRLYLYYMQSCKFKVAANHINLLHKFEVQSTKTIKANWGETSSTIESHKSKSYLRRSPWQKTSKRMQQQ